MKYSVFKHPIRQIFLFIIMLLLFTPCSQALTKQELDGYEIKCDYRGHTVERKLALQYFHKKFHDNKIFSQIEPEELCIDLYDIDDDGQKEILAYVDFGDRCPRAGCPFATLRKISNDSTITYEEIKWGTEQGVSFMTRTLSTILISKTLGYHDMFFKTKAKKRLTWKWNGKYYN